ncbi:MAG TPA: hypothetical protein PKO28_00185 [Bacilli bacterium]|nr:hypothetical protein [Bacilli bacterium]HPS18705.1 hypothetical protein [Bacilli bacterium]
MADYIYINDYLKRGKLAISYRTFNRLAAEAIGRIPGINISKKNKGYSLFRLNTPVNTTIRGGIVHVSIAVDVVKGTNIQEVSRLIQDEINNVFMISTEQIPFDVQVRVVSII